MRRSFHTPAGSPSLFLVALFALCALALASGCGGPEKNKTKLYHKGQILAKRGRYAEAVTEYKKALAIDPQMSEARYELGRCYAKLQYDEQAIRELDAARALDPGLAVRALSEIAAIYSTGERPLLAEEMLGEALEVEPDNIDAVFFLAGLKQDAGKTSEARSLFEKALEIDPAHVKSLTALAEIALQEGEYEAAEKRLKKITTEIDPNDTGARLALAKVYRFSDREREAVAVLEKILDDNPDNVVAQGALAEAYYAVNRLDDAQSRAEAFLKAAPGNIEAYSLLGAILLRKGDYESAMFHLTRATNSPRTSAQKYYLLGLAQRGTKQLAQAIATFQKVLTLDPDNTACRMALAQTLLDEGSFEKARREAGFVLSDEPGNDQARQLLTRASALSQAFDHIDSLLASEGVPEELAEKIKQGLKAFRAGDLQKTQAVCEDLIRRAPDSPLPLNLQGLVRLKQNEIEQALAYFRRASEADPEFAASHANMAGVYMAIGSYEQAAEAYRKAAELAPGDGIIRQKFVKALTSMRRYDEAEELLRNLARENPDQTSHRLALAGLLISTKNYQGAREELAQVLELEPDHGAAAQLLAETYAKEGDIAGAAKRFERITRAHPQSTRSRAMLALCHLALDSPERAAEVFPARSNEAKKSRQGELARAVILQAQGQYDESEKILASLGSDAPAEAPYELMLANVRASKRSPGAFTKSSGRDSYFSETFRESYLEFLRGESLGAEELFQLNLGMALSQIGWRLSGVAKLEDVLGVVGPNAAMLEIIGGLWLKEGQPDKAISSYQTALVADPQFWPAYYQLGNQSLRAGQTELAQKYFESALKRQPDSLTVLRGLSRAYERGGNDKEAIKTYRKIIDNHPNLASVMNNLAWLLAKDPATLDQALEYAGRAAALQPFRAETHDTVGWIYYQRNDYHNAMKHLERAMLLNSLNPSIRYHRGMTRLKLGDTDEALEDFRKAGSAVSPFPEKELNAEMIRQLG
jgi:tetratricopeptide (TPR) repeat protein